MPDQRRFSPSALGSVATARGAELSRFDTFMKGLQGRADYIVIDTPGNDTILGGHAHSHADVLVTPINDSFIDLDVIARLSPLDLQVTGPGHYTESVWEQRALKQARDKTDTDWIVLRNRLGAWNPTTSGRWTPSCRNWSSGLNSRRLPGFRRAGRFPGTFPEGPDAF